MNKNDIFSLITNVLGIDSESVEMDADFYEDLNAESTDMIELHLQLEDLLQTKIDKDQFEEIQTVDDLIALIEEVTGDIIN